MRKPSESSLSTRRATHEPQQKPPTVKSMRTLAATTTPPSQPATHRPQQKTPTASRKLTTAQSWYGPRVTKRQLPTIRSVKIRATGFLTTATTTQGTATETRPQLILAATASPAVSPGYINLCFNHRMARRRSLTIASVNVNGMHAADRNGISAWIADRRPDVVTLQEVRAPDDIFTEHVDRLWGKMASRPRREQQKVALELRSSAHITLQFAD